MASNDLALRVEVVSDGTHRALHAETFDAILASCVTREVQLGAGVEEDDHHATRGCL